MPTIAPSTTSRPTLQLVEVPLSPPPTEGFSGIGWSPDGLAFAASSVAGIYIFSMASGPQLLMIPVEHGVDAVTYGPTGKQLYALTQRRIAIWDASTGQLIGTTAEADETISRAVGYLIAVSPDGKYVVAGGAIPLGTEGVAQQLGIWDLTTGEFIRELLGFEWGWALVDLAFSPDGSWLATGSVAPFNQHEAVTTLWDTSTWSPVATLTGNAIAMSPDGALLATSNGGVHIWDAATLESVSTFDLRGDSLTFNSQSDLLAFSGNDGLRIWDTNTWEVRYDDSRGRGYEIKFSPSSDLILGLDFGFQGQVTLWRVVR